jgi:hydrogenase expression/formation protein HypE
VTDRILLGHGSGGRLMHALIRDLFVRHFGQRELLDAAKVDSPCGKLAFTTDSYVVSPIFFPGGDIGGLSVNGTVNDLSMVGAEPHYLTVGMVIEEGFAMSDLRKITESMAEAALKAGVRLVAGDTKVVERGKGDGIFINTAGVGSIPDGVDLSPAKITPGDAIIVSGPIGEHGMAVMAERNGLSFVPPLLSDTRPLSGLVRDMLRASDGIRVMRDPTRGGLATTLKEFASDCGHLIRIREMDVPVSPSVRGACALLGLDPLYVASEGVLVAVAGGDVAEYLLRLMRGHEFGRQAAVIGSVEGAGSCGPLSGAVVLETEAGGERLLDMLSGEQLPRIC